MPLLNSNSSPNMGKDSQATTTKLMIPGTIPEQRPCSSPSAHDAFPSVFVPTCFPESKPLPVLLEAIKIQKDDIELALHRSGAVLLRGFDVLTASDFDDVLHALGYDTFTYRGRGVSKKKPIVGRVVTASTNPHHVTLGFHNEMAYRATFPSKIIFYCNVEPPKGATGATPIVQGHVLYQRMVKELPELVKQVESKGLSYLKLLVNDPSANEPDSWQAVLHATTKEEAEKNAKEGDTHIEWKEDNTAMSILGPRVGVRMDTKRERKVWFNSIDATYMAMKTGTNGYGKDGISFGDGSSLSESTMLAHNKIMKEEQVAFRWQRGDVLILDNNAVMHAKEASQPPRKILASLCAN